MCGHCSRGIEWSRRCRSCVSATGIRGTLRGASSEQQWSGEQVEGQRPASASAGETEYVVEKCRGGATMG